MTGDAAMHPGEKATRLSSKATKGDLTLNLRKLIITVCALVALGGAAANVARASNLQVKHKPWKQMTNNQKIKVLRKQINKDRSVIRFWTHHRYLTVTNNRVAINAKQDTQWAKVSLKIASHNLHRLLARPRVYGGSGGVAHFALWNCIHSGEGNGHPSTNHPYSGPLQMTSYWAGYPVYDWGTVPVRVVYADAEQQLQKHIRIGDAYYWVSHQWPNTHQACMQYL